LQNYLKDYYNPEDIRTRATSNIEANATALRKQHRSGAATTASTLNGQLIDTEIEE